MSFIDISGKRFFYNDSLSQQINVGLRQMKIEQQAKKLKERIEAGKKFRLFEKLASLIPFKIRMHYATRKMWYDLIDVAIKKNFTWKVFRIPPKELWYRNVSSNDSEELKAGFFGLWEAILQKQRERLKISGDSKQNNTELTTSQKDTNSTI